MLHAQQTHSPLMTPTGQLPALVLVDDSLNNPQHQPPGHGMPAHAPALSAAVHFSPCSGYFSAAQPPVPALVAGQLRVSRCTNRCNCCQTSGACTATQTQRQYGTATLQLPALQPGCESHLMLELMTKSCLITGNPPTVEHNAQHSGPGRHDDCASAARHS
jgi:hypothetical protein